MIDSTPAVPLKPKSARELVEEIIRRGIYPEDRDWLVEKLETLACAPTEKEAELIERMEMALKNALPFIRHSTNNCADYAKAEVEAVLEYTAEMKIKLTKIKGTKHE